MNSCTFEFKTHLEFSPEEIRTLPIDDIIGSVAETRDRFAKEYFDSVMNFIQSSLFDRWFGKKYDRTFVYRSDDVPFSCPKCNGKKEGFIRKGKRKRKLKTSLGEMTFSFFRLECRSCKAKFSPFPLFFGIGERVRLSEELLRKLLVMATEVPYKKASDFSRLFTDVPIGAKTVWNKAQEFGEKAEDSLPKTAESDVGMGDSTKVKAGNRDTHKRGLDAHVVIACEKEEKRHGRNSIAKTLLAFSVSSGSKEVEKQLKRTKAKLKLMIADGERGMRKLFARIWKDIDLQRCIWHLFYQMGYFLWKDGVKKEDRDGWIQKLKDIVYAPKGTPVPTLKKQYRQLCKTLEEKKMKNAANYLMYALPDVFTFRNVKKGKWIAQSVIERLMREINRRADIGRRWTEKGADNLLRLRLLKMLHPEIFSSLFQNSLSQNSSSCLVTRFEKVPKNTC
jgi:hypothetical protein